MTPAAVQVPPEIAASIHERWPAMHATWARDVEREFDEMCLRHGAVPFKVLPSRYSVVVIASAPRRDLIVRVTPDPNAANQATVAQMLAECGAGPRIHAIYTTASGVWTISDRVVPGISLDKAQPGSVGINEVAATFRAMVGTDGAFEGLPAIGDWLHLRLTQSDLSDVPRGQTAASPTERERAQEVLRSLDADSERAAGLCHGDAHPGNLLVSADQSHVQLVDPRGMRGEVEYDLAVLSLKVAAYDLQLARSLCTQLAGRVSADDERAAAWITVARAARV